MARELGKRGTSPGTDQPGAKGGARPLRLPDLGAIPWRSLIAIFLCSRITIWLTGYLGARAFGSRHIDPLYLCRNDCLWYVGIVTNGYQDVPGGVPPGSANWAFFPLYPLLTRLVADIAALDPVVAGLLVSNLAFLLALIGFYAYCRDHAGFDHRAALYAATLLCYSPGTIYFMSPYTESLFLLLSVLAFHFAASERWVLAGITAACLSATRAVGILVAPSLLLIALRKNHWATLLRAELRYPRLLLAIALTPLGLAAFMAYLYLHMGDALAFQRVQLAWGREFGNPLQILWRGLENTGDVHFWYALVTTFALVLGVVGVIRGRYAESFLLAACILTPLSSFLFSMPRYVFSLFPFYITLGLLTAHQETRRTVLLGVMVAVACIHAIAWALDLGFVC